METVRTNVAQGLGEIILNRPAQRNAVNLAMCAELRAAAVAMAHDDAVKVVLVRGEGPVFCAGADMKERQGMNAQEVSGRRAKSFAAYDAIEAIPKPVVAVVDGPVVGSGCEIAASCDFVVGTLHATFRYPEVVWGTVGATQRLPRIVGKQRAKELLFTGRIVAAEEAARLGLITRLVEREALEHDLAALTQDLLRLSPEATRLAKRCLDEGMETDRRGALAIEMMAIEELLAQADWKAGIANFLKKDS